MKPYLLLLSLSLFLLPSCGALVPSREEQQRIAAQVDRQLNERHYRIGIDYMTPLRGGGKVVSGSYSVTVDGAVIDSHLPYVGRAHSIPYGGGKVLTFKDEIDGYADEGWKRGRRTVILSTDNGEDVLIYTLSISEDGRADVRVQCRNRDDISYQGTLEMDRKD